MNKKITISLFFSFLLLAILFIAPVQADAEKDEGVIITVEGGFGVNIEIENTRPNDTISYNFTIIWRNILNRVIWTTEDEGTVVPYQICFYREALVRAFTTVHIYVESEGVIVEREGFSILVFVFLKPNIEPT